MPTTAHNHSQAPTLNEARPGTPSKKHNQSNATIDECLPPPSTTTRIHQHPLTNADGSPPPPLVEH
ncbi:hypothetical protein K443DRAFT_13489 [Laccaria amethystina LaAM-08-1]|uniref:Uncharacterized protein n=1 Tax=Laccaria amethystina LaAM-08-1 TaxID=1095629 RepID=A0A0C9WI99_9AGAR|nr:hypothetical protein K443DRAFT_13489 [Laccaria amethystina LaAM-08-1]